MLKDPNEVVVVCQVMDPSVLLMPSLAVPSGFELARSRELLGRLYSLLCGVTKIWS